MYICKASSERSLRSDEAQRNGESAEPIDILEVSMYPTPKQVFARGLIAPQTRQKLNFWRR